MIGEKEIFCETKSNIEMQQLPARSSKEGITKC